MRLIQYYKHYSLSGVKRHKKTPSKEDLPEAFVDLMKRMGYEVEDSPKWKKDCIAISRGAGTEYVARYDFKKGVFIARVDENLGRITTLGLKELTTPREVFFEIPETETCSKDWMLYQKGRGIDERIPKFRDHLNEHDFYIKTKYGAYPSVVKKFLVRKSGELWESQGEGCISVFPSEPWGEELYRLCKEYK